MNITNVHRRSLMTKTAPLPTPSAELRAAAPDLARRLGLTLGGLCTAIGPIAAGKSPVAALITLVWKHIFRRRGRLEALLTRVAAGWLPRPPTPRPTTTAKQPTAPEPVAPAPLAPDRPHIGPPTLGRLPRGRAWLVRIVGYQAAGFGSQLDHLLADPAMAEFVACVPSAARMLRPLCRALGISPPALGFPPPPPPRQVKPARPKRAAQSAISQVYAALALQPAPAPARDEAWPWLVPRPVWRLP
jgi:hypothetical protein